MAGNIFTGFFQIFARKTSWILSTVFFKLPENNTTIRREVYTGLISFLAVSYIPAVNPAILGSTGMDRGGVFLATALAGFIGTLSMALYANKPLVLGPSTTTTFAESAVGIGAGARTGLAALTAAVLFIISIVGAPIFLAIPGFATAPALIIVGFLMIKSTVNIDWNDWPSAIPAYLLITGTVFTCNISDGLGLGIIFYTLLNCRKKAG